MPAIPAFLLLVFACFRAVLGKRIIPEACCHVACAASPQGEGTSPPRWVQAQWPESRQGGRNWLWGRKWEQKLQGSSVLPSWEEYTRWGPHSRTEREDPRRKSQQSHNQHKVEWEREKLWEDLGIFLVATNLSNAGWHIWQTPNQLFILRLSE